MNATYYNGLALVARVLISILFIVSGFSKIMGYAFMTGLMQKNGVPGYLLPLVIATELGGGLLLLLGFQTRIVAFLLAGFSVLAAFFFHLDFGNQLQMIQVQKNLAIAGGLLFVMLHGAGAWSLDAKFRR